MFLTWKITRRFTLPRKQHCIIVNVLQDLITSNVIQGRKSSFISNGHVFYREDEESATHLLSYCQIWKPVGLLRISFIWPYKFRDLISQLIELLRFWGGVDGRKQRNQFGGSGFFYERFKTLLFLWVLGHSLDRQPTIRVCMKCAKGGGAWIVD